LRGFGTLLRCRLLPKIAAGAAASDGGDIQGGAILAAVKGRTGVRNRVTGPHPRPSPASSSASCPASI
jgi:hypothetical protein